MKSDLQIYEVLRFWGASQKVMGSVFVIWLGEINLLLEDFFKSMYVLVLRTFLNCNVDSHFLSLPRKWMDELRMIAQHVFSAQVSACDLRLMLMEYPASKFMQS